MKTARFARVADARLTPPEAYGSLPGSAKAANACTHTGWTEERVQKLKELHAQNLSAGQMAKALGGVTRNAVIGKVNRMGWGRIGGEKPAAPGTKRIRRPAGSADLRKENGQSNRAKAKVAQPAGAFVLAPANRTSEPGAPRYIAKADAFKPLSGVEPVPFIRLFAGRCRWPVGGEGADMLCCGARADGGPYCASHTLTSIDRSARAKREKEATRPRNLRRWAA